MLFTVAFTDAFGLNDQRCECSQRSTIKNFYKSLKNVTADVIVIRGLPVYCQKFISEFSIGYHVVMSVQEDDHLTFNYIDTDYHATAIFIKDTINFIKKEIVRLDKYDIVSITLERNNERFYILESCYAIENQYQMMSGIDKFINSNNWILFCRAQGITDPCRGVFDPPSLRQEINFTKNYTHSVSSFQLRGYTKLKYDGKVYDDNRIDLIVSDMDIDFESIKSRKIKENREYRYECEWEETRCGQLAHEIITFEYKSFF